MKVRLGTTSLVMLFVLGIGIPTSCDHNIGTENYSWCDETLRPELGAHEELTTSRSWFKVFGVGNGVFAILEPYNFQEIVSYLIIGNQRALLFDTGMGMDSMSLLIEELTDLPVTVINSHTHYDHIGSNHEFDHILGVDTAYTHNWSNNGWGHEAVRHEVAPDAFCSTHLPHLDTAKYQIFPYEINEFVKDGQEIDLGERIIKVLFTPGHTPDAISLYDKENGYLWTGDTFYEGTIWLFFEGTDLDAYHSSITKMASLSTGLKSIFPGHNLPISDPQLLPDFVERFEMIINGDKSPNVGEDFGHPEDDRAAIFDFGMYSFLIRKDALKDKGIIN